MPQARKYPNRAAQQAAYRRRCAGARMCELAAKGMPVLPAICTMPGWPRWTASLGAARELVNRTLEEMRDYCESRSEEWQESERGDEHQERTEAVEAAVDALADLIW